MMIAARPLRPVDLDTFTDLTPVAVTGTEWVDGELQVTFAADLPAAVADAIRRRMQSRNATEEELRRRAEVALTQNRTYLTTTPTTAQAIQQVAALTRQNNGIIRMLLGQLDSTD